MGTSYATEPPHRVFRKLLIFNDIACDSWLSQSASFQFGTQLSFDITYKR